MWISPDIDGHNGGIWKMFKYDDRIGTFDKNLVKIKD